jgi:hypothetical protein
MNPISNTYKSAVVVILAFGLVSSISFHAWAASPARVETRSGVLEFDPSGYPTDATVDLVFDEMAYHGATQAYLWAVPILVNVQLREGQLGVAGPLDLMKYVGVKQKRNVITANMTTPYILVCPNLKESGPLMVEVPTGPTGGAFLDIQHRNISDTGLAGPDKGKGGKYLILHASWEEPKNHGADYVIRSKTYQFWGGLRILTKDPQEAQRLENEFKIYPLGGKPETKVVSINDTFYRSWHKDGMDFWKDVHALIQVEDLPEEDRYILQFLKRVGIEKGKPFNPTERQKKILLEAEKVGKTMAASLSAARARFTGTFYDDGSQWTVHMGGLSNSQHINPDNGMKELDGLVSYSWEAIVISDGMLENMVGVGSKYLAAYKDADGNWLNGSNTYQLTVPTNVPAKQFWSFIVYSHETRIFVDNRDMKPGVRSLDKPVENKDGSVTITIGPQRPANVPESNFIYSNPNEGWFTYFRTYAPTEAYFNKTWRLPDIKKVSK